MAKKILITDDEPDIVKVVRFRLIKHGFEVTVAVNGQEGLDKAKQLVPDLILLDYRMPLLNGDEVCRRLKADAALKHIPVILMTASTQNALEEEVKAMGANDFVLKPFDPDVLFAKIQALMAAA